MGRCRPGLARRRRHAVRVLAHIGELGCEPSVPVRPLRRGAAGVVVVETRLALASPGARRRDPHVAAPIQGAVRRVRDDAVPRRSRRPGLPPRHRHEMARRHDHRGAHARGAAAVAASPPHEPARSQPGKGRDARPRARVGRPHRDGWADASGLGALSAVPRRPPDRAARSRVARIAIRGPTAAARTDPRLVGTGSVRQERSRERVGEPARMLRLGPAELVAQHAGDVRAGECPDDLAGPSGADA